MKFYSFLERPATIAAPSGERFSSVFREVIENDVPKLEQVGQHDIYQMIQSNTEFADLRCIMEKFQRTGDPSLLNRKEGFYADLTGMPNNLLEAQNKVLKALQMFDNLKPEVRNHFGGTLDGFLKGINTSEGVKYLEDFTRVKKPISQLNKESEVVLDANK